MCVRPFLSNFVGRKKCVLLFRKKVPTDSKVTESGVDPSRLRKFPLLQFFLFVCILYMRQGREGVKKNLLFADQSAKFLAPRPYGKSFFFTIFRLVRTSKDPEYSIPRKIGTSNEYIFQKCSTTKKHIFTFIIILYLFLFIKNTFFGCEPGAGPFSDRPVTNM